MPETTITFDQLESEFLKGRLEKLIKSAYEQGVEDARKTFSYPEVLTKDHLVKVFQVEKSTVNKIIAIPTFPKLKDVRARYPREQVFSWISSNSTWVDKNTNYFNREVI
ncbi:hypothetical protein [Sutcliffiella halmapala]|uniref:hypothetical protein n=1 Tax=Sutcliffiella halmapala TaxID=79882 RepID=UPI001F3A407A|nr:hypothetical protein [Sutcliffiella halmapala]